MKASRFFVIITFTTMITLAAVFPSVFLSAKEKSRSIHESITIKLPETRNDSNVSVEEALLKRRSIRNFKDDPLRLDEISQLLWAAQGITNKRGYRTAPSAGALYPLEVYLVSGKVNGLYAGIYKYIPYKHELIRILRGEKRLEICNAALGQTSVKDAPAVIIISAIYKRTTVKYRERGIQYVHMEAGHVAQNIFLQAVALDLGAVVIGAFHDDSVKKIMKMEDREQPLYIMPVGRYK